MVEYTDRCAERHNFVIRNSHLYARQDLFNASNRDLAKDHDDCNSVVTFSSLIWGRVTFSNESRHLQAQTKAIGAVGSKSEATDVEIVKPGP